MNTIALFHPQYGLHCAHGHSCKSLVDFREIQENITIWTLLLRNVSSSLSGKHECVFTLYPEGIWTKTYHLLIQTPVKCNWWREGSSCFHSACVHSTDVHRVPNHVLGMVLSMQRLSRKRYCLARKIEMDQIIS